MTGDEQLDRTGGSPLPTPACPRNSLPMHDTPSPVPVGPCPPLAPPQRAGAQGGRIAPGGSRSARRTSGRGTAEGPVPAAPRICPVQQAQLPGPVRSPPRLSRCHPPQPPTLTSESSEKAEDAEQRHGGGPVPPPVPGAVHGSGRALSEVLEPAAAAARTGRPRAGGGAGRCAGAAPCSVAVTVAVSGPEAAPASAPSRPEDTAEGSKLP